MEKKKGYVKNEGIAMKILTKRKKGKKAWKPSFSQQGATPLWDDLISKVKLYLRIGL
ncbi:MAG: hypothetical protein GY714_27310 [Desulfobacterales bacterium]|nr:hypothetical protein [Desulfobacterales bacterium]